MKRKLLIISLIFGLIIPILTGCSGSSGESRSNSYDSPEVSAYQDVFYTAWPSDLKATLQKEAGTVQSKKPYTVMMYMNGSDLESDGSGCASDDIQEMLDSDFDPDKVNVVIYCGGTKDWVSDTVDWSEESGDKATLPDETSAIYTIVKENGSNKLKTVNYDISESNGGKQLLMMDGGTLAGFIDYAKDQFPADKYSLVFWNHGSGSLIGYGYDELIDEEDARTSMNLLTIQNALNHAGTPLDFVGFDTCLMGNLETALAVKNVTGTLVASQELEPGDGWNYTWLKALSDNTSQDAHSIGKAIVDSFNSFYKENVSSTGSSLSVTDVSKIDGVLSSLSTLMNTCTGDLAAGGFNTVAQARDKTETFGSSDTKSDKYEYMTDIGDIAKELSALHPAEAQAVESALKQTVVYSKTTDYDSEKERKNVNGLSVYYPYAYDNDEEKARFNAMKTLGIGDGYINYINSFSDVFYGGNGNAQIVEQTQQVVNNAQLQEDATGDIYIQLTPQEIANAKAISFNVWQAVDEKGMEDYYFSYLTDYNVDIDQSGKINTEFGGVLPMLGDDYICLYEIESTDEQTIYSSPAKLNGEEVNLLVAIDDTNPDGKILGAQPVTDDKGVPSREVKELKKGDKLILEYYAEYLGDDPNKESEWYEGNEMTVGSKTKIKWVDVPEDEVFTYGYGLEDVYDNVYYTDMIDITFS